MSKIIFAVWATQPDWRLFYKVRHWGHFFLPPEPEHRDVVSIFCNSCTQSNTYTSISLFCNHTQASKKNIRRECYYIRKRYCKFICWWAKKHLSNRYFKLYQILWRIIGINRIKSLFCSIELFFLEYFVILFLQFTTNPDGKVSLSGGNAGRK